MEKIAIVDLKPIILNESPSVSDWNSITKLIGDAMHEVGFLFVINHGVDEQKIANAFSVSKQFFEQPKETKLKYGKNVKISFSGYLEPGREILELGIPTELRETFDLKDNLISPVKEVPNFETILRNLEIECKPLIFKLLKIFAKALKLENENYFIETCKYLLDRNIPSYTTFRSIYYPKIAEEFEIQPGTVRCAPHTDYGILTLLFQDNVGGLEVEVKMVGDKWIHADPIPGSILINTGDLLEFWSGGYFPATYHRILIPESEIKKRTARQAIASFVHPDDETIVTPLKKTGQQQYKPVSAKEHAKIRVERSYRY